MAFDFKQFEGLEAQAPLLEMLRFQDLNNGERFRHWRVLARCSSTSDGGRHWQDISSG